LYGLNPFEAVKRTKGAVDRSNRPFGAFKRTKGAIDRNKVSFWSVQKDKNNGGTEHIWSF
ncbi:hypothetical protein, partial [Heyndrickxia faecalis]